MFLQVIFRLINNKSLSPMDPKDLVTLIEEMTTSVPPKSNTSLNKSAN